MSLRKYFLGFKAHSNRAGRTAECGSYLVPEAVAVKMHCVQVYFIAHAHQIPVDLIPHVHGEALQVSKHSPVDGWGEHVTSVRLS
jgi:hypothetical protein